jgi:thymidylate synthase
LEVNQSQIERLKAQYMIAKQAVHMQNNQISRKDKENAVLRKMNSKYYDDWKNLAELNKQMLRELEDASNYKTRGSPFGPNHDVY